MMVAIPTARVTGDRRVHVGAEERRAVRPAVQFPPRASTDMTVSTVSKSQSGAHRAPAPPGQGAATAAPGPVEQDAALPDNLSGTDSERAQP